MEKRMIQFEFRYLKIRIKWIPEGWWVMMIAKNSNITINTVPDKNHTWEPHKEDWKKITMFGIKNCRSIITPEGWLIYILNNGALRPFDNDQMPITVTHVCTKYIHDPDHVYNPDETKKETAIHKTEKKSINQTSLHPDFEKSKTPPSVTEAQESFTNYQISVKKNICTGVTSFPIVEVSTVEELKEILKNQFRKSYFTLVSMCMVSDISAIHNKRSHIPIEELNEDDLAWLAEKSKIDSRHIE